MIDRRLNTAMITNPFYYKGFNFIMFDGPGVCNQVKCLAIRPQYYRHTATNTAFCPIPKDEVINDPAYETIPEVRLEFYIDSQSLFDFDMNFAIKEFQNQVDKYLKNSITKDDFIVHTYVEDEQDEND